MWKIREGLRCLRFLLCLTALLFALPVHAENTTVDSEAVMTNSENRTPYRTNALTDEEIAEGWVLVDGYAYPPESVVGNRGYVVTSTNEFADDEQLTNVTFRANVQSGLTAPCMIYFTNAATYQEYYVELYSSAGYETTVRMPPGSYFFTGGGPESDDFSVFDVVSPESFTVRYHENMVVVPVIRSRGSFVQDLIGIETEGTENQDVLPEEVEVKTETREDETPWYHYLLISVLLFGAAGSIVLILYIRRKYFPED